MSLETAELRQFLARKQTPVSDSWRPGHKTQKKSYGLILFKGGWNGGLWEMTSWHATERARNDAITNANKYRRWSPVVAMMKIER